MTVYQESEWEAVLERSWVKTSAQVQIKKLQGFYLSLETDEGKLIGYLRPSDNVWVFHRPKLTSQEKQESPYMHTDSHYIADDIAWYALRRRWEANQNSPKPSTASAPEAHP
jgi:hypothetical protein